MHYGYTGGIQCEGEKSVYRFIGCELGWRKDGIIIHQILIIEKLVIFMKDNVNKGPRYDTPSILEGISLQPVNEEQRLTPETNSHFIKQLWVRFFNLLNIQGQIYEIA